MYPKLPSPSLRNLPLDRLTLFDMIDVVVKYSIDRLSMDSGSSDVGEGGRGIGIISGLSTRGSGKVEFVHLVLSSLPSRLMMICKVR
jgi:hypothetical protein